MILIKMTAVNNVSAFNAFEAQLKSLCLQEFPCGIGTWRENHKKKKSVIEKDKVLSKFSVTLKEYGAEHFKTESLDELISSKRSPWNQDYSWSSEAKELREIAVKSPWLIDEKFVLSHFKTLRIVDKGVTEVDENFLNFPNLHELTLTANKIKRVHSRNLPSNLKVLEVCANEITDLSDLCEQPPPLMHLGLGHNVLSGFEEYITGEYWPQLLSLDLAYNNLCDLMDVVRKLQTLPKLRNLILQGNPLSLVPGYRGFVIDSLRTLDFLDDQSISADEKHHYKGLARRKEYILDEAKIHFSVDFIKGIPQPEELKSPEEFPEFPVITRNYYVQFMFLEDKSVNAEILQLLDDDQCTLTETARDSLAASVEPGSMSVIRRSQEVDSRLGAVSNCQEPLNESNTQRSQSVRPESEAILGITDNSHSKSNNTIGTQATERATDTLLVPSVRLAPLKSTAATWAEEMDLNWHQTVTRDDLEALRDFCLQGMEIKVMEEKVQSYPADQIQDGVLTPMPAKGKSDKADKKKDDKGKDKEEPKKKKKKGEPEVEMVCLPAEYTQLATFQIPLSDFLDGERQFENVYMKTWEETSGIISPVSDVTTTSKKEKKKSAGKKEAKEKDSRKSPKVDRKQGGEKEKTKSKGGTADTSVDEPLPPPPPLEVKVKVKLHHWKTAMDSIRDEQDAA